MRRIGDMASVPALERQPGIEGLAEGDWFTPDKLFRELEERYGPFDLDAAATPANTKCRRFFTEADNALEQPWFGRVWCNPPHGRDVNAAWCRKAIEETAAGRVELVCLLMPASTAAHWFHELVLPIADELILATCNAKRLTLKGRSNGRFRTFGRTARMRTQRK